MVRDKRKWLIVAVKVVGATGAIVVLTVRAVYGAGSSPLPDGFTGPALIGAALMYMAKTIYELVVRRKEYATNPEQPKLNATAWQMLIAHMEREEKLFESLTAAQDRTASALTALTIQIAK